MSKQLKLYLFGDQTVDIQSHLKSLLRHRNNPVLEDFLGKAYNSVRTEIFSLPSHVRDELPRFTCVDDLLSWDPYGKVCIPLDMAVVCLYQLGTFISQADASSYADSRVLGLCTGALAAAAVSCSQNVLDLVPLAVDAVTIAFKTGMLVADTARRVAPTSSNQSWSIIVPHSSSSEVVHGFSQQTVLPLTSRPYISAYAPNGITISGPPKSLEQLLEVEHLRHKSIPIYGPYHASHLYTLEDIADVIGNSASTKASGQIPLLSRTESTVGFEFASLMADAVEQILLHPIKWNALLGSLHNCIQRKNPDSFTVVPIGTTADQLIFTALRQTQFASLLDPVPRKATLPKDPSSVSPQKPKLAIVGMSGRFPGAKDNETFWDVLYQGLDMHKPVPDFHWNAKTHVDPTGSSKNTSATPFGCWLEDPAAFDARFFNISPREAPQIDPAQRIALMTAYEAIEQAGIVADATPSTRRDRVGVFYGVTSNDWMETNSSQNIDTYFIPGGNRAFIPGRINYFFKFSGPSYAVDTACSSSLAGIHLACNSLWRGDIDTAIAGGTNVLTNPDFTAGLDRGHFLSRTGNCKTFDDGADGYCRGEGVGTVILKRLDDALADHDPILGVILGAYTNHSAESESITRPHVGAQRAIFRKILNQSGVDSYSVSYVEMHGTGTQAGDAGEMLSVLDTFAPSLSQVQKKREADQSLYIGSAKSNIGHGEAASGVSSLIKVLLMMQKNTIVPHCGIKTKINHKFPTDLEDRNVHIARRPTAWNRSSDASKPRRVFVNNFSAAGGNSALLLEDAPLQIQSSEVDPRSVHLVAVSAKNGPSLQGNLRSFLQFIKQNPSTPLGQLSYTTTARRIHHPHRVMLAGSTPDEIATQIQKALEDNSGMTRAISASNMVFAFTGQGAQYPGMGHELFESFSVFRNEMRRLDHVSLSLGFPSMLPVIQSNQQDISGFAPLTVQLANVCMQISLSKLWTSWNISPSAVVGHSLGEYSALNVAGVLSDADTLYLVGKRAELLQQKCTRDTHSMLVVKGSVGDIAVVLKGYHYETACINSPVETVLAGSNEDISVFAALLSDSGMKSTLLKVPYAFHSSQLQPMLSDFKKVAGNITFSKPKLPILCPLHGTVIDPSNAVFGPDYLVNHSRQPVNIQGAFLTARNQNIITDNTAILELGPHPAISGMVKPTLGPKITSLASSQRGRPIWNVLGNTLRYLYTTGSDISWVEYQRDFQASHTVLSLPSYTWDLKDFWIPYVNDWSLRKGDPPLVISNGLGLESTTIHKVVEETSGSQSVHLNVQANIAREDLSPLVQGHEVDGIPLCTPSVYADMALSLGTYLIRRYQPTREDALVDVSDMSISKALILKAGATEQLLQAHVDVDWSTQSATVKFMSFDNKEKLQVHSQCVIRFTDRSLQQTLQNNLSAFKQNVQALQNGIVEGTTARFNRPMVYRAIRPLARFHDDYRAIDEIVLNSNTLEATSQLSFGTVKKDGIFHTHPAVIDSLTQSCGFTMNCNDYTDLDKDVFMNHGWGSLQIFQPLDMEKVYTTYTQMKEGDDKLWHGDVVICDGDTVVAHFGQIRIQGVPRRVLKFVLSMEIGKGSSNTKSTVPAAAPVTKSHGKPAVAASQTPKPSKLTKALTIISEESGVAVSDLTDKTVFADMGIDSLLGLTISARFGEELDTDMDFNALFFDYPSVSDLKVLLERSEGSTPDNTSDTESDASGVATPATEELPPSGISKGAFEQALQILSEESGIATEDLTDDMNFADSGLDSLLSLVIVGRFRDELEMDIPHESLFLDFPTMADLKRFLLGDEKNAIPPPDPEPLKTVPVSVPGTASFEAMKGDLVARKEAVDVYLQKHLTDFSLPRASPSLPVPNDAEKVILVTGASGSLGGHLVYHLAQLPDVKTIICLNRENRADPFERQIKAMRSKGIRFPEHLKSKLLVLQTDSSKSMFGLSSSEYNNLVSSVTHLIHNAWPMSAKRALSGFESQFQVMRNLIDFASQIVTRRPDAFRFCFQMVSSIGVVGHYGLGNGESKTFVPEDRVDIDAVLCNGYSEAKWGCERMLDETLHRHPSRFRTMVVRLGQIAGSKTSGYWNPMEHFGFLVKSSQTLNALPDVDGTVYWTPVNDMAGTLSDLVLSNNNPYPVYHIENPVGQPWKAMNVILADALKIPSLIPFHDWVERVRAAPQRDNPASTLLEFLDSNYLRMSCGGLVLNVEHTLQHSKTLASVGAVSEAVARKYIQIWREIGFIN